VILQENWLILFYVDISYDLIQTSQLPSLKTAATQTGDDVSAVNNLPTTNQPNTAGMTIFRATGRGEESETPKPQVENIS